MLLSFVISLPFSSLNLSPIVLSSFHIPEYLWRLFHWGQLDFDYTLIQFTDIILRPNEIIKTTKIRKQIKNQWSRDDPSFVLLIIFIIFLSSLAYCFCFSLLNPLHILRILIGSILIEFILIGIIICSSIRWWTNKYMRIQRIHTVEQSVEWLYSWDIHCNSLIVSFLLVSTLQYILIPILTIPHSFLATALGNTLYLLGITYYSYITFLGYSALPFIDRPERLFYPMGPICLIYILMLLINFNISGFIMDMYFGHSHHEETLIPPTEP